MEIIVLGTSCMMPTKNRNVTSFFVNNQGDGILIDSGEGTQRQMQFAGINRNRVKWLLITHWHADHTSGIPGLLQTLNSVPRPKLLRVIGPKTTTTHFGYLLKAFSFGMERLSINIREIEASKPIRIYNGKNLEFWAVNLKHSIPVLGYSIIKKSYRRIDMAKAQAFGLKPSPLLGVLQKGGSVTFKGKKITSDEVTYWTKQKKVTFIIDTIFTQQAVDLAKGSDILICEATYTSKHEDKALEYKHMTSKQAAIIAQRADVKRLYLTHFSQRYKSLEPLLEEAKKEFKEVYLLNDLDVIKV